MKKEKIIIWGAGEKADEVYSSLDFAKCDLVGIVDRNINKHGKLWKEKYKIISPDEIVDDVDYYIISVQSSNSIIADADKINIPRTKIIRFWQDDLGKNDIIKKEYLLERENKLLKKRLQNAPYEYGTSVVEIMDNEELFNKLINEKKSLARFGDGEFEIIMRRKRGWFQKNDDNLAKRLQEVLTKKQNDVIIAIADNFGNLDKYTTFSADGIREYLTEDVRNDIMNILPIDRQYGDAYITRPYFMYKDKTYIKHIIELFKRMFNKRNILIVENKYARMGINNNLFEGANIIRRIICPKQNAFDYYDKIINTVFRYANKDDLILISLGQTATVLAFDLGNQGYQAIDIGQLDTEYEWYLMNADDRVEIPGKAVAELMWWHEPEQQDSNEYNKQVVFRIGE